MKDHEELKRMILEAEYINDEWNREARDWYKMYAGDQWDEDDKSKLDAQDRPVLTFNITRPLIRLLAGMERKSRYDIKVLPTGEGTDNDVARLLTGLIKFVEEQNNASYIYSEAYKHGLITGRGWVQVDLDYTQSMFGDVVLRWIDPYEMFVDPYARQYDMSDARYMYKKMYLTKDEITELYPQFADRFEELQQAPPEFGDTIAQQKETFDIKELWYKEMTDHTYLVRKDTGEMKFVPKEDVKEVQEQLAETTVEGEEPPAVLVVYTKPEMYYAVISGNTVIEQAKSPFIHSGFPYTPFFPDFIPRFGSEKPKWHSLITDLVDPQREKNKRRSTYIDILIRFINTGWIVEKGALLNKDELEDIGKTAGFIVEAETDMLDKILRLEGKAPDAALLQLDQIYNQDIDMISGVPPSLHGVEESSRESGRTIMLRQQQGHAALTPFQDNMRLTRKQVIHQILSLIVQVYTPDKIARLVSIDGTIEGLQQDPEGAKKLYAAMMLKSDDTILKYDIGISETPSTPTTRQMEFVELMEMMQQQILPPTPGIIKLIIKSSDIAVKNELLAVIEEEMAKQQQQQEENEMRSAVLG